MSHQSVDRREFAKRVAVGAVGGTLLSGCTQAEDTPQESPAENQAVSDETAQPAEEELILQLIRLDHPEAVPPEAEAEVLSQIRRFRYVSSALARFPLSNGDAPMPAFQPYRADD